MSSIGQGGPSSPLREEWPAPIVVLEALTRFVSPEMIHAVRTRLGACCMRQLFLPTAGPITLDRTRGAFYKGMRLMAIDGVSFDVPDTPANAKAFGRPVTRRYGESVDGGYPQIHLTFLSETGTHVIGEAFVKRGKNSEFPLAGSLLRKVPQGSLVLWDRGFYGYASLIQAQRRGVQVLGRVADHVVFERVQILADGSYWAVIYPSWSQRRRGANGMTIRVIDYTLDDPQRPGYRERHRLVTTLLDADTFPAIELVVLYHERWEIEIGSDELKTHQLDHLVHLRSRTPCGLLQEIYGIFLAYNAVQFLMHEAALSVDIDPRRLSFIHAVRVLRETAPLLRAAPTARLATLYAGMIAHLAQGRLPPRDNRINPRVIKNKMSNFPKKRAQHYRVQHPQTSFEQAVRVLK